MPSLKTNRSAVAVWHVLFLSFACAGGCASMRSSHDIIYAQSKDSPSRLQTMDIYAPGDSRIHPVILMIHGGDWTGGDKADHEVIDNKMPWFVKQGFCFASMNYRLAPAASPADQANDLADALQFIDRNMVLYGGDSKHILLLADGAGAYLAAAVANDPAIMQSRGMDPKELVGVAMLDPMALDLPSEMPDLEKSDVATYRMYLSVFGPDSDAAHPQPHLWQGYSPLYYLNTWKVEVPYMIAISGDTQGPDFVAAQQFTKTLQDAKIPVKFSRFGYLTHLTINSDIGKTQEPLTNMLTQFFANPAGYASGTPLPQPE